MRRCSGHRHSGILRMVEEKIGKRGLFFNFIKREEVVLTFF